MNYLRPPCDVQLKIISYVQEKGFNDWYAACIDYYHNYSCDTWELWNAVIFFLDSFGVGSIRLPADSIPLHDPIMKAYEYEMVAYHIEVLDLNDPFFSNLTNV